MPDREKITKGLECHKNAFCEDERMKVCPYWQDAYCSQKLSADALILLKEQQEEIQNLRKENNSILTQFHEWAKQQKAVEPKEIVNEHFPIGDYRRTIEWLCGKCGKPIMGDGEYCSYCGQAVKWE